MSRHDQEFETLFAAVLDGNADASMMERFQHLMRSDVALRVEYTEQMRMQALLEYRSGNVSESPTQTENPPIAFPRKTPATVWWAAAAAVIVGFFLLLRLGHEESGGKTISASTVKLEVLEASQSISPDGRTLPFSSGAKLSLSELQMPPGNFRFRLESGAVVAVTGPADLKFVNPMHLRVLHGKVTADVGENAKGFIVETAQTRVVDLGTRFGVDVAESGHTDVVVFEGEVELHDTKKESTVNRLVEGEAVRVNIGNQLSRISSITSGPEGDDEWSSNNAPGPGSVITAVHDDVHNPNSNFYYRILRGGMREDARAFIAKRHEWNGIDGAGMPAWLDGADLVQTYGAGSKNQNIELTVDLAVPAVVYLFVDRRVPAPEWLMRDFIDTGESIGLENAPLPESGIPIKKGAGNGNLAPFGIWKKELPAAGGLVLGPPPAVIDRPHWMYGIAAKPL